MGYIGELIPNTAASMGQSVQQKNQCGKIAAELIKEL
jgi:hypothetical protein